MDRDEQREMMDRTGRDEAALLQTQQVAAGAVHGPVHAKPPHGGTSLVARSALATTELSRAYEQSLDAERAAWHSLTALPADAAFDAAAWNRWRAAVEDRELATSELINYALAGPAT
ncbi:hypothetical protein ACPWT1_00120 [Ramlibacter sp. MMS24-I3-19]|uniref:hypothetical protein n=1 Tax=Ramlibacter sp. MMS24-I3-19 TaxID=3416606 RepID=UPI003D061547